MGWPQRIQAAARKRMGSRHPLTRSSQVLNIDITPGRVESRVQGSQPKPYRVEIEIKPLSNKEWDKVADAMASQAIFAARLLAGEMPQDIEQAFAQAGVNLFPATRGDLKTECSCPDWSNPCKHIAAAYYLLGEHFDADPFLIFRLRGKSNGVTGEMRWSNGGKSCPRFSSCAANPPNSNRCPAQ